jgi:hypothetical protein
MKIESSGEDPARGHRLARIMGPIANLMLLPLYALYAGWVAGGRVADLAGHRRRLSPSAFKGGGDVSAMRPNFRK